ncbi:hypothetical protein BN12_60030 [Nostocoides japonicum T1-X7]|uniref:Reverse transcriptase domain-containing protein n=1 Tax=Nostocoides japonicum T1-X7 TaxID=1194083 RepID=A0A077M6M2_9MICO|nr:hypothetical protein BN12_60030 [Tetrasphaera japonica T1-X7]
MAAVTPDRGRPIGRDSSITSLTHASLNSGEYLFETNSLLFPVNPKKSDLWGQLSKTRRAPHKAFLKAGVLTELGENKDTHTGTPQGGILSPLLANIALSVLDEHLHGGWKPTGDMATSSIRARRRRGGQANWRVVRYADDFVVLVHGTRDDVEALREDIADVLQPLGLRLSETKTQVVHMSEGFDFLGFRIQWRRKYGSKQVARLHLHRRPADPVVEGEDPCADEQDLAAESKVCADQAQPDHARLVQLLQARGGQAHLPRAIPLRVVARGPVAAHAAPLEVEGRPPTVHHPRWTVETDHRGRDRAIQPRIGAGHPVSLPRQHDSQPLDPARPRHHGVNCGEPGAVKVALRVRRAAWGNGPGAIPTPRPRPTQPPGDSAGFG